MDKKSTSSIALGDWIIREHSMEEAEKLFISMDKALKDLHVDNKCVDYFYPTEIFIDNGKIVFNSIINLSEEPQEKAKMINEDILKQGIIHFSYYYYQIYRDMNYYDLLNDIVINRDGLQGSNFSQYLSFFPQQDIGYYKQMFENGVYEYYSDYKQSLGDKEKEDGSKLGNHFVKKSANQIGIEPVVSEYDNHTRDAFVSLFLIPVIIVIVLIALILFKIVVSM